MNVTISYCERLFMPIKVVSEANGRGHWSRHNKRRATQRMAATAFCRQAWSAELVRLRADRRGLVVHLERVGGRKMDSDNLACAFKAVRDGIADWIGIDDGDERIEWRYSQRVRSHREQAGCVVMLVERPS